MENNELRSVDIPQLRKKLENSEIVDRQMWEIMEKKSRRVERVFDLCWVIGALSFIGWVVIGIHTIKEFGFGSLLPVYKNLAQLALISFAASTLAVSPLFLILEPLFSVKTDTPEQNCEN